MGLPIRWSPRAANHLESIFKYIARDSIRYAALFAQRLLRVIDSIPDNPNLGKVVPEYEEIGLRERIFQGYRIIYRVTATSIEIVAISHGARRIEKILDSD